MLNFDEAWDEAQAYLDEYNRKLGLAITRDDVILLDDELIQLQPITDEHGNPAVRMVRGEKKEKDTDGT